MRNIITYILFVVFFVSAKNNLAQSDSVQLDSVLVTDLQEKQPFIRERFSIPKLQKQINALNDIGELLQSTTPVQINSYGLGNSSSVSIRGANDDHTNVLWNGLKINSLTLGGTDISLIPIESGEDIQVQTNTNAFGGEIDLNSKPDWNNRFYLKVCSDIGSFNSFRNSLSFKTGDQQVQFQSSTSYLHALNNFPYTDLYKFNYPTDTADHNLIRHASTVNSVFIQLKHQNFISVGSWFQIKNKDIPNIMGMNVPSSKFQRDWSVRHYINWDKYSDKREYHVSIAHSYDELHYVDKRLPTDTFLFINSNYKTHRITNLLNVVNSFKHGIKLTTGYEYNLLIANVQEYVKKVYDHVGEAYAYFHSQQGSLEGSARISQPFSSFKYIRPQFYVDAGYTIPNRKFGVLFSYSDKYRFPDLNDRYWSPGGNPKLKPELGWTVDLSNTFTLFPYGNTKHRLNAQVNLYYSKIKNNIVWTPVTNAIWSPKNLKLTRLYGIESQLSYSFYSAHGLLVSINTIYDFNRSQIIRDENNADLNGNLLRYKPQHTFKMNYYMEDRFFGIGLNYQYISKRYTDEENFEYFSLKPYHLVDVFFTFKGDVKRHHLQFVFKISNIGNVSYESIRSYAQPGRYYTISFIYNFNKHV